VREVALALYPEFVEKLFLGGKVVDLKAVLEAATFAVVKSLVLD
jgi:hypothetical protein